MSNKTMAKLASALFAVVTLSNVGCVTSQGPNLGILAFPIPVSAYLQDKKEDEFWMHERYERSPILPPITSEGHAVALDPPSDDEVMRALEDLHPVEGGIPFLHEVQRMNVRIVKEKIEDYLDPVRVYPLVGPAQLHHAHYKCTVYFSEKTRVGWPVPHTLEDEDKREVIYIDHNHLHMVATDDPNATAGF